MSAAVSSKIDFTALNTLVARRRACARETQTRLELLRRLHGQYVACNLPTYAETRVEQSFNEQLFAKVFDYRTLFSHDGVPYHLEPKNACGRRYDDFSLGRFGVDPAIVVASAELKSPDAPLDAPQSSGSYKGITPVEQAFRAATQHQSCRWVLLCNYRELRLYAVHDPNQPLAVADLHEVRNSDDLALLCAHFDRNALLGTNTEAELTTAQDPDHPSSPIAAKDGHFRFIQRLTPAEELDFPLYNIESTLNSALDAGKVETERFFGGSGSFALSTRYAIRLKDGWVSCEGDGVHAASGVSSKIAVNRRGECLFSVCIPMKEGTFDGTTKRYMNFSWVAVAQIWFAATSIRLYRQWFQGDFSPNRSLTAELREVANALLLSDYKTIDLFMRGECPSRDIIAGPFKWLHDAKPAAFAAAQCASELAIQFRHDTGGVRLDLNSFQLGLIDGIRVGSGKQ